MSVTHGHTRTHWMIGTPIGQVQMPGLANTFFGATGRDEVLVPLEVHPENLELLLRLYRLASNVGGLISTLPHKAALNRLVERRSKRASLMGMVNVVRKEDGHLVGDMLDGEALILALQRRGFSVRGSNVLVVGCGGFGSAAAFESLRAGARQVDLLDIDRQRSVDLALRLREHFGGRVARSLAAGQPLAADLLVQASSQGLRAQDKPPVPVEQVCGLQVVVDAVAGLETGLMRASRAAGLAVVSGEEIAQAQLEPVLKFWASAGSDLTLDSPEQWSNRHAYLETPR